MAYRVEVYDRAGVRAGSFDDVPLLEVVRNGPDGNDRIEGLLPTALGRFGVGYTVRVGIDGALVGTGTVTESRPAWGDVRRLILDRYVNFQELVAFVATRESDDTNPSVAWSFQNTRVDAMVRTLIDAAPGPVHYTVDHEAYPDGAAREYAKFSARRASAPELSVGSIGSGQWVGAPRIDASGAYAKDGDTIAGLVVDGIAWPDLRLMLIDCEETSLNSHAIGRHPEVADWDAARYGRSVYKRKADAAKAKLQEFIDTRGIDYIELNPHQDASGNYDDRVDIYGRYLGLVYGGGECFNAGLVEWGLADVYLYDEGRYHAIDLALKDFFSYTGPHADSIGACGRIVGAFTARGGLLEVIAALAALGDGYVFHVDLDNAVHFRPGGSVDEVVFYNPVELGVELGRETEGLVNLLRVQGDPVNGGVDDYVAEDDSIDAFGTAFRFFPYYAISQAGDAEALGRGLLKDLAWPARIGRALFHRGTAHVAPGDLLEFRGEALFDRDEALATAWGGDFGGRLVGRVRQAVHRIAGETVETQLELSSPYRSVARPLAFITRSQDSLSAFFQFRLDDGAIGLDTGYHLD